MEKQMNPNRALLSVLLSLFVVGCSWLAPKSRFDPSDSQTVAEIMFEKRYTPIDVIRNDWGVGTVINFQDGVENIVWFDSECLGLQQGDSIAATSGATLNTKSMYFSSEKDLEGSMAENLVEGVDLSGAYKDGRVVSVEVSFSKPFETVVSDGGLTLRIEELVEKKQSCVERIISGNAFVIDRTVSAAGFISSFSDDRNFEIKIDADLLSVLNADGSVRNRFLGSDRISSEEPRILGYRIYKYILDAGISRTGIVRERLSPEDIEKLKEESRAG